MMLSDETRQSLTYFLVPWSFVLLASFIAGFSFSVSRLIAQFIVTDGSQISTHISIYQASLFVFVILLWFGNFPWLALIESKTTKEILFRCPAKRPPFFVGIREFLIVIIAWPGVVAPFKAANWIFGVDIGTIPEYVTALFGAVFLANVVFQQIPGYYRSVGYDF